MRRWFRSLILLAVGLAIGAAATVIAFRLLGPGFAPDRSTAIAAAATGAIWTCSMHPQIRMSGPGRCPLCGMDLVPVERSGSTGGMPADGHLELSEHARRMAAVETAPVEERELFREIRALGKVDFDETRVRQIAA